MRTATGRLRRYVDVSFAALVALMVIHAKGAAQTAPPPTLLQVEVRDSIGLPLPDAKIEAFAFMDGGIVLEWVPVEPNQLPPGIVLLRFSHPGYRSAVFSIPLREDSKVSLRVPLDPQRDSTKAVDPFMARPVRAIGLALDGHAKTDIIGSRRVLVPANLEQENVRTLGSLMQRATNTELNVLPARGGTFNVYVKGSGSSYSCPPAVMINGDRRRVLPFPTIDGLYRPEEVEAVEIFTFGPSLPFSYVPPRGGCGLMVMWLRNP